ncbi:MAG TPA: carboxymuconolactone decarboxylase family protein [Kofleriaceae bacterium]|nr:carboxymuconolactone decarboxylase family protein [Kofleriaceae bacterium]
MGVLLLNEIEWSDPPLVGPTDLSPELRKYVKKLVGGVPLAIEYIGRSRWIVDGYLSVFAYAPTALPHRTFHLVSFVVSQANACRYCYGSARSTLRIMGFSEATVSRIERDLQVAEVTERDSAMLQVLRALANANPMPTPEAVTRLAALGFSPPAIAEAIYSAGMTCLSNRLATCLALPPDDAFEKMAQNPIVKLFRPLVSWKMRKTAESNVAEIDGVPATPPDAAFGSVINGLGDSPAAAFLARIVSSCLADGTTIPRRAKLLMFAVVARALASGPVFREVHRLLVAENLAPDSIASIVDRLGGDELTPLEQKLIPFARDTARYQTPAMQERTRELSALVDDSELIEAVATAGLANAVVRIALLSP